MGLGGTSRIHEGVGGYTEERSMQQGCLGGRLRIDRSINRRRDQTLMRFWGGGG